MVELSRPTYFQTGLCHVSSFLRRSAYVWHSNSHGHRPVYGPCGGDEIPCMVGEYLTVLVDV